MDKKLKPGIGVALVCFILNTFLLPGLGSLIAGREKEGRIQIIVFALGIPLTLVFVGAAMMLAMWIWALITGIDIVKEADK